MVEAPTTWVRFFLLAGTELTLTLPLAACPACAPTLGRKRPGPAGVVGAWLIWSLVLVIAGFAVPGLLAIGGGLLLLTLAAVAGAGLVAVWHLVVKKPRGAQTSYWQPVWIHGITQRFSGEITALTFGFSSRPYAIQFLAENPAHARLVPGDPARVEWSATARE